MNQLILHLGSNQGERHLFLGDAILSINRQVGIVVNASDIYETAAWGNTQQADFLNIACLVHTELSPFEVLAETQAIEQILGRQREEHWGPRTIDIDLIFYNDDVIRESQLEIPHPFLAERRFVLQPLADLAPNWQHPVLRKNVAQLLVECEDEGEVWVWRG